MSRRKGTPWKHRPYHRAFSRLSAAARQAAIAGFRAGQPTTGIAAALKRDHGATIPVASLNRYREWWETTERPVLEAAEKTEELLQAFRDRPTPEIERVIHQLLLAQRLTAMTEDKRPDPIELGHLAVREKRLQLQERALALREQEMERKVATAAGNVEKALKRKQIDPETIRRIKEEVYGLTA